MLGALREETKDSERFHPALRCFAVDSVCSSRRSSFISKPFVFVCVFVTNACVSLTRLSSDTPFLPLHRCLSLCPVFRFLQPKLEAILNYYQINLISFFSLDRQTQKNKKQERPTHQTASIVTISRRCHERPKTQRCYDIQFIVGTDAAGMVGRTSATEFGQARRTSPTTNRTHTRFSNAVVVVQGRPECGWSIHHGWWNLSSSHSLLRRS